MKVSLRPRSYDDIDWLVKYANNPNIAVRLDDGFPQPYTREDAERRNLEILEGEEKDCHFAIMYHGEPVGHISLIPGRGRCARRAHIGYWLGEPFWGRGIMKEAVRQMCEHAWEKHSDLVRIDTSVWANNIPSAKVLERNGFVLEGTYRKRIFRNEELIDEHCYAKFRDDEAE